MEKETSYFKLTDEIKAILHKFPLLDFEIKEHESSNMEIDNVEGKKVPGIEPVYLQFKQPDEDSLIYYKDSRGLEKPIDQFKFPIYLTDKPDFSAKDAKQIVAQTEATKNLKGIASNKVFGSNFYNQGQITSMVRVIVHMKNNSVNQMLDFNDCVELSRIMLPPHNRCDFEIHFFASSCEITPIDDNDNPDPEIYNV